MPTAIRAGSPARQALALLALLLARAAVPPAAHAADIHLAPGQSIETAVGLAGAGDTIWLAPGEYHESVYIDRGPLTIASTDGPSATILYPQPGHAYGLTAVYANGVTISGLTIRGTDYVGAGTQCGRLAGSAGIRFTHSSGTVENCVLDLFTGPGPEDVCFTYGILNDIVTVPGSNFTLTVSQCTVRGFFGVGLAGHGSSQTRRTILNAYQNRVEGIGTTTLTVQYGVQLTGGARGDVAGNLFLHHLYGGGTFSTAVFVYGGDAPGSRVAWNNFGANQSAAICYNAAGTALCSPELPAPSNWWAHGSGPGPDGLGEAEYGTNEAGWLAAVTAYDVASGIARTFASDEGTLRGARMLTAGMLCPPAPALLEFPLGWIEYVVENLPFGGSPDLTLTNPAPLPTPVEVWEYSPDSAHPDPWWHPLADSDDDGDGLLRWSYGTLGPFGNEESRWVGVGGPAQIGPPVIVSAEAAGAAHHFSVTWQSVPGHRYRLERAPTPGGAWAPVATLTATADEMTVTDTAVPAAQRAAFYRVADLGPAS